MAEKKTPEQIKAEAEAKKAEQKLKQVQDAEARKAVAEQKKAERAAAAEAKKAEREAKKAERAAAAEAKKAQKAAAAEAKKAEREAKKAEKEAAKMPMQNAVRRPKPDTLCGQLWAIYDNMSGEKGSPVAIGDAMDVAESQGFNDATIRTQYARWRKYYGIEGSIESQAAVKRKQEREARKAALEADRAKRKAEAEAAKAAEPKAEAPEAAN